MEDTTEKLHKIICRRIQQEIGVNPDPSLGSQLQPAPTPSSNADDGSLPAGGVQIPPSTPVQGHSGPSPSPSSASTQPPLAAGGPPGGLETPPCPPPLFRPPAPASARSLTWLVNAAATSPLRFSSRFAGNVHVGDSNIFLVNQNDYIHAAARPSPNLVLFEFLDLLFKQIPEDSLGNYTYSGTGPSGKAHLKSHPRFIAAVEETQRVFPGQVILTTKVIEGVSSKCRRVLRGGELQ